MIRSGVPGGSQTRSTLRA